MHIGTLKPPDLTFSINPAKLEVVSAGQTSNLSVSFDGKAVEGDITTTQVAVWKDQLYATRCKIVHTNEHDDVKTAAATF